MEWVFIFLSIKEIEACRREGGRIPDIKDSLSIFSNKGAIFVENFLKNSMGRPPGPGLFPDCIELIALISSSAVSALSRVSFWFVEI